MSVTGVVWVAALSFVATAGANEPFVYVSPKPGARFVALEGRNHLILEDEPAWPRFLKEVLDFLAEGE